MRHVNTVTPVRVCFRCCEEKPINEYRSWESVQGFTAYERTCLSCSMELSKIRAREYGRENREAIAIKRRERYELQKSGLPSLGRRPGRTHEEITAAARERHLRRKYGLTHQQYLDMLDGQLGGCNICGKPPGKRQHMIDHCHKTGRVRGVLCSQCNSGIGMLRDSTDLICRALLYLQHHEMEETLRGSQS